MTERSAGSRPEDGSWLVRGSALLPSLVVGAGITLAGWLVHVAAPSALTPAEARLAVRPSLPAEVQAPAQCTLPASDAVDAGLARSELGLARVVEGVLRDGDTLFGALSAQGVPASLADRIGREMARVFDFRNARAGHAFRLVQQADGSLRSFRYKVSDLERYRLLPAGDGWRAEREEVQLERRRARVAGIVTSTLYDSVQQLGESSQLAKDLAGVFAWDVDFSRSTQPGDEFRVIYERLYAHDQETGEDVYVGPGRILAARYSGGAGDYTAVYFETEEGRGGYYRPDGSSVERQFLVAPVSYTRISSAYSSARLHPILKVRRPHPGIDYAAPVGTPVWSVGDGRVIYRGWASGFGRLVKVRHANGYVSYYGHLSRFAKGLVVGKPVRQKQPIGYVGKSGLATGPHVCFRIAKDGRYVNPNTLRAPAGEAVPPAQRVAFEFDRDELLVALGQQVLVATDEAL